MNIFASSPPKMPLHSPKSNGNHLKKFVTIFAVLSILTIVAFVMYKERNRIQNQIDYKKSEVVLSEPSSTVATEDENLDLNPNTASQSKSAPDQPLPSSAVIKMPFLVQAPSANWDAVHEDACEETSLIMVKHYLDKTGIDSPDQGEKEIENLLNFENKNGYGPSITLDQLASIAKSYFGLKNARIVKNVTKESMESELAEGKPIIVPAAGKVLPNPNFRSGGPNYHMLVVKGYNSDYFITNDPGTRNGEGFKYKFNDLINSIHDWNAQNILNGEKAYLVFD